MSYKILQKQEFLLKSNACEFCVDTNARRVGMPQLTLHQVPRINCVARMELECGAFRDDVTVTRVPLRSTRAT